MNINTKILGTGSFLPEKVITNNELTKSLDTSDEWIVQRTGIKSRHVVADDESCLTMAQQAAKSALANAKLTIQDIDMVLVASCTQEKVFPSLACLLQDALGIKPCPAFDLQAACSGFVYGLTIADQFIKSGTAKNILLVGSEAMSRVVDWQDRASCVLFGDGAGAFVLGPSDSDNSNSEIIGSVLGGDGNYQQQLYLNNAKMSDNDFLQMQGNAVFKLAVNKLGEVALQLLEKTNMTAEQIDWLVPHQANIRIIQATAKKLNLSMNKVILTVSEHANTSAASIPLAFDYGIQQGHIQRGQTLLLEAFGGGLTWGATLVRY